MVRRIYFAAGGSFHSLFRELLQCPPDGYEFVVDEQIEEKEITHTKRKLVVHAIKSLHILPYIRTFWWQFKWFVGDPFRKLPSNIDLIYSANRLILKRKAWVVAIEHLGDLCPVIYDIEHLAIYRRFIERVLSSKHCKKVMPYLEIGKKTLLSNLNCENFKDKIEVVHLGIHAKNFVKDHKKEKVSILFLGTANVSNIPGSFEVRGGKELLEAFTALNKKYNNLELILRTQVPDDIRNRYAGILKNKNVKVFDDVLPFEQFDQIMKSADILLFPGYLTPAMTILDGMSYELPVIATNIEGISEMVKEGETGFLIKKAENTPYTSMRAGKPLLNLNELARRTLDINVVKELIEKTSILIESKALRQKMGREGRKEIEKGEFSLNKRNEKLKRIFDEAIENA